MFRVGDTLLNADQITHIRPINAFKIGGQIQLVGLAIHFVGGTKVDFMDAKKVEALKEWFSKSETVIGAADAIPDQVPNEN
jgi:hypothetical protein